MKKFSLLLISTYGVGLGLWRQKGLYDREIGYYKKLGKFLDRFGVLSYDRADGKPEGELYEHFYNRFRLPKMLFSFLAPLLFIRAFKKYGVIRTNQFAGAWTAALMKLFSSKKLFIMRGGHAWDYESGSRFARWCADRLTAWSLRMADSVFFVSSEDQEKYLKRYGEHNRKKMRILPNAVDTSVFSYEPRRPDRISRILLIGRLVEMKNFQSVLQAVVAMDERLRKQVSIDIIGEGEYRSTLESIVREHGLPATFHGVLPNDQMAAFLKRSDIFIMPQTYGSGMSKGILEAMATGNIVIASDLPAHRNTIDEGINGLICKFDTASIRERIEYVLARIDAKDMVRMRAVAAEKVRTSFSMETIAEREYGYLVELTKKQA